MTIDEFKKTIDMFHKQGRTDEDILAALTIQFQTDQITADQYESLAAIMGYEFNDNFKKMSTAEKKRYLKNMQ